MRYRWLALVMLACALVLGACSHGQVPSGFRGVRADHQVTGTSVYPLAVDANLVGTYPADTGSGAGYFYDDVLEYRVWLHPDKGAEPLNGDKDYFVAFAQYERAEAFSQKTAGAEAPLALVRQFEWIDEPKRGDFVPEKGERITEWQVQWLQNDKRGENSIAEFMKHPREADPNVTDKRALRMVGYPHRNDRYLRWHQKQKYGGGKAARAKKTNWLFWCSRREIKS